MTKDINEMASKTQVTVLTLVYNGGDFLKEAVNSILNQDYKDFIYLIIDDCSTDNSYHYLKSINDKRIKLIRNEENIGVSNTFNKALEIISTPILIRLDQDDVSLSNRVGEQTKFLLGNPLIDVICSWEYVINNKGKVIGNYKSKINNYAEFLTPIFLGLCPIWHPSLACRTNSLRAINGFNNKFKRAEDFDVTARLALSRFNASICRSFHLKVRRHSQQQSNKYELKQKQVSRDVVFQSISIFIKEENDLKILSGFLLRSLALSYLLNVKNIERLSGIYNSFINSVIIKQLLNKSETASMNRIISTRVGWGLHYYPKYSFLPLNFSLLIFIILSPQYIIARLFDFYKSQIRP